MSEVAATFDFVPLARAHLPLVRRWLGEPHVARWYDLPDTALQNIERHIDETEIKCFLVRLDGLPIGYIQAYDPHAYQDHPYRDQPAGTRGIDQFIGEPDLAGCGHGPRFMREFVAGLFERGAPRVVTDPDPANGRAIRAYIKAGFRPLGERNTIFGHVLLMACDRP
jgi:aminoglycoside 6'-N-acetyltransferase